MRCSHPAPKTSPPPNSENDEIVQATEASRVISVSFVTRTKTYLDDDGFQPVFVDGDKILVANGQDEPDTCIVSVTKNKATISTKLDGPLTAVYPYKATKMSVVNPCRIDSVLVSTVQSGEFADANICMAKMQSENDENLSFENKTAMFRITPTADDISYLEVRADGFQIANIAPPDTTYADFSKVRVKVPDTDRPDEYFISILVPDGLTVKDLSFFDGTNVKAFTTGDKAATAVTVNTIYTVTVEPNSFAITVEAVSITGASFRVKNGSTVVTEANPGEFLKVEVTCPNGYNVGGITIYKTGDSSTTVEVGTDGNFTMPSYPVTVKVEFELDESGGGTEMEPGGLLP